MLDALSRHGYVPKTLIMGDFNAPVIDWGKHSVTAPYQSFEHRLYETVMSIPLSQHVNLMTRCGGPSSQSLLDLTFTPFADDVSELCALPPLDSSDHLILDFLYKYDQCVLRKPESRQNFWKADYDRIRQDARNLDWSVDPNTSIDRDWLKFKHTLESVVALHPPITTVR